MTCEKCVVDTLFSVFCRFLGLGKETHRTRLLLPILSRRRQAFPEVQETEIFRASTAECCGDCLLKQQSQECDFSTKT